MQSLPPYHGPNVTTTMDPPPDGPETISIVRGIIGRYRKMLLSFDAPRAPETDSAIAALDDVLEALRRRFPDA